MFKLSLDGRDYLVEWRYCSCNSYPVAFGFPIGFCGKCKERMSQDGFDTKKESETQRLSTQAP